MSERETHPLATSRDDDEINLGAIFAILMGRKLFIASLTILGLFVGAFVTLSQPRIYAADALVQLEEKASSIPGLDAIDVFSEVPRTAAEIEILRSRMVVGNVVDRLDLTLRADAIPLPILRRLPLALPVFLRQSAETLLPFARSYDWGDAHIAVGQFVAPAGLAEAGIRLIKTGEANFDVLLPNGRTLSGTVGELLVDDDVKLELKVDRLDGRVGRAFSVRRVSKISAIQAVQGRLSVAERGRGTSILTLTYRDSSPDRARNILDGVALAYLEQNIARTAADIQQSLEFIERQLPQAKARADDAQGQLNAYLRSQNAVDLERESEALLVRLTELQADLAQVNLEEERISRRYLTDHPIYQDLLIRKSQLEQQVAELAKTTESLPDTQKEVFNLRQAVEISQEIYRQFLNRSQELGVARASTIGNVRIVDDAIANYTPVEPRTSRALALGLILGFILGCAGAMLRSYFRRTVDTLSDLEPLGLSLYGVIGAVSDMPTKRPKRGEVVPRLSQTKGNDAAKEAFKSIRTSLHFGLADKTPKAVAITSAQPGDGKSFVSHNIAEAIAATGQMTVLVDTDMRRGYLHRTFGVSHTLPGLSEYLAGDLSLEQVCHQVSDNLFLIPRGQVPPNPSELLMSRRFADMVTELDTAFAVSVYDTPPVLAVTDPLIVFRHVPIRLGLVRHGKTELTAIGAVKSICDKEGLSLDGLIVNNYDERHAKAYGYGGYGGYGYGYGYGYAGAYSYGPNKDED